MKPIPFPLALNIGTDIVHLPRITRLLSRPGNTLPRFTRRILHAREQQDFRARFALPPLDLSLPSSNPPSPSPSTSPQATTPQITPEMTRWLAGRFAAKEAARKAAPSGAAHIGWKDVVVRTGEIDAGTGSGRPEVVYLDCGGEGEDAGPGRVGKLSISHDGEYVVAMVVAAG
ncbi:hypothetical protein BO71DRAFT_340886 [Aspergillus ellipticus CBS 707.79]|uniref:4'-phosphopantetheinyl transferase domain-containing protein n=1 Tax=Aspergillus ellipticus CBS 707.79 TaxID=1448320 RepID=A0A319DHA9_9EURO|nr:hypothetical protein BO71DRAFT_340886 [Aspergillus ellipticus CBS 707.79]